METTEATQRGKRRRNRVEGTRRNVTYQRYNKPPYTYLGMVVMTIESAPGRRLTLGGIHAGLKDMFPFFTGPYTGWKDSVRHNLSHNSCFYKVQRETRRTLHPKGNHWMVDLANVPEDSFQRQSSKKPSIDTWAKTLDKQLGVPPICLDSLQQPVTSTVLNVEEPRHHPEVKRGVKNFRIDTILKSDDKDEKKPCLESRDSNDRLGLNEQQKEFNISHYFLPGVVFRDNPQLVTLLTATARQNHGNQDAAILNLRSLCPPANYGTPPTYHRTWTTQPTSPNEVGVNVDNVVQYKPEPMDVIGTENENVGFDISPTRPAGVYFGHSNAVPCRVLGYSRQRTATTCTHCQAPTFSFDTQILGLKNGEPRKHNESLIQPMHNISSTSTFCPRDEYSSDVSATNSKHTSSYSGTLSNLPATNSQHTPSYSGTLSNVCATNSQHTPSYSGTLSNLPATNSQHTPSYSGALSNVCATNSHHTSSYSGALSNVSATNSQHTPSYSGTLSPMSVAMDDSRSSFTSATYQSQMSSASALSPVSSYASLQDITLDSDSQMSSEFYTSHDSSDMFIRSIKSSSSNEFIRDTPIIANTQNLDMLATWAQIID